MTEDLTRTYDVPVPPVSELFDPEHPEHDPVGTIRRGEDEHSGTWVCEPYQPAEGHEFRRRWRCLDSTNVMLLGETVSHRWLVGAKVIGVVEGTPAAKLWAERNAALTPERLAEIRELARVHGRIPAIKRFRELTGCSLSYGKDFVDDLLAEIERDSRTLAETEQL